MKICENPQTLLDIFLNYDCNLSVVSIFERIVNVCARVAQGGRIDNSGNVPEDGNWTKSNPVSKNIGIMNGFGIFK